MAIIFWLTLCFPACSYWCASPSNIQTCAAQGLNTSLQMPICGYGTKPCPTQNISTFCNNASNNATRQVHGTKFTFRGKLAL